jgi:cobalt/nickel transport system permease protein
MAGSGTGTLPRASAPGNRKRNLIAAAIGSYAGINAASLCAAIEFGIQPMLFRDAAGNALYCPYDLRIAIPGMMIGHLTIFGLAEVIFTAAILSFVYATMADASSAAVRQQTSADPAAPAVSGSTKGDLPLKVLLGALIVLTPLGLLAEGTAWGEWGAEEIAEVVTNGTPLGYTPQGLLNGWSLNVPLPDYALEGMPESAAYILSAVIGASLLIILFKLFSLIPARRKV